MGGAAPAPAEDARKMAGFSRERIAANTRVLTFARTLVAAFAGASAGILGLETYAGFLFYFAANLVGSALLFFAMHTKPSKYLVSPNSVWTEAATSGFMTYLLVWTLVYNLVHVY